MLQETKLHISEVTVLDVVVKLEMYMQIIKKQHNYNMTDDAYYQSIKALHDEMNKLWWEMETDKDYTLFEEV